MRLAPIWEPLGPWKPLADATSGQALGGARGADASKSVPLL